MKPLTDAQLEAVRTERQAISPGPWSSCGEGKCKCSQVWSSDYPVAEVIAGEWGDSYPAIRLKPGTGSIQGEYEAYIEHMPYGEVTEEQAIANRLFIAHAPDCVDRLLATLKERDRLLAAYRAHYSGFVADKGEVCPIIDALDPAYSKPVPHAEFKRLLRIARGEQGATDA